MRLAPLATVLALTALAGGAGRSVAASTAGAGGYRVLLTSDRDGTTRGYSVRPDGSGLSPILPPGSPLGPAAISGDGRTIAYAGPAGSIYLGSASGARLRRVVRHGGGDPTLSQDGKLIALARDSGIWVVRADGHGLRRLTKGDDDTGPDWSPGAKSFVFDRGYQNRQGDQSAVVVQPLHGKRRVVAHASFDPNDDEVGYSLWSPDGRWISYLSTNDDTSLLWLVRPNGSGRRRIARDVGAYAWSPDGKRLAVTDSSLVEIVGVNGRVLRRLHPDMAGVEYAEWSPDARQLLLVGRGELTDPDQIWVVGVDGSGLRRLTSQGSNGLIGWTRLEPVQPEAPPVPPAEHVVAPDTVATSAPVAALAADGGSVAFVTKERTIDCDHVSVWTPADGSLRRFGPLPAPCTSYPIPVDAVALAGSRVAWTRDTGASCEVGLLTATFGDPAPQALGVYSCTPSAYHVHGDGELLVFDNGPGIARVGGSEECQQGFETARICTIIRTKDHVGPVDSVSGGLIAVREPGAVAVLDANGALVRVFPFAPDDVDAARLDGGRLVVWRFGVLEEYEVATDARELTRPLPAGYRLVDVDGGIAVLQSTNRIELLRLADGHSFVLQPGQEPTLADLEPPGLYYSYATGDGGGRVVFVPRAELEGRLR